MEGACVFCKVARFAICRWGCRISCLRDGASRDRSACNAARAYRNAFEMDDQPRRSIFQQRWTLRLRKSSGTVCRLMS